MRPGSVMRPRNPRGPTCKGIQRVHWSEKFQDRKRHKAIRGSEISKAPSTQRGLSELKRLSTTGLPRLSRGPEESKQSMNRHARGFQRCEEGREDFNGPFILRHHGVHHTKSVQAHTRAQWSNEIDGSLRPCGPRPQWAQDVYRLESAESI